MYSPESSVRKTGSYIYEEFMPTDGTDVKVEFGTCVTAKQHDADHVAKRHSFVVDF